MSHYSNIHYDFYKNSIRENSYISTINSINNSTTYKVKATFLMVPVDVETGHYYTNVRQVSNFEITRDDYGYNFPQSKVYCLIQFFDSTNTEVKYVNSNTKIKITIGNYDYNVSCFSSNYVNSFYKNNTTYKNCLKIDCGIRNHNPTSGSRSSENVKILFTSTVDTGLSGSMSTTVYYNTLYSASSPTLNYYSFYSLANGSTNSWTDDIIITTNRINSNLTHDLYLTVAGSESAELFCGNADTYYIDNYKIASGVGSSYTLTASTLSNILRGKLDDVPRKVPCFLKCNTKYNGQIIGTTFIAFYLYTKDCGMSNIAYLRFKITNSNNSYIFNNQPYFNNWDYYNHRIRATGMSLNCVTGSYTLKSTTLSMGGNYGNECTNNRNTSSATYNFTDDYTYNVLPTLDDANTNTSRELPVKYFRGQAWTTRSDGSTGRHSFSLLGNNYNPPHISYLSIYRVDNNDVRDEEGEYVHISFDTYMSTTRHGQYWSNWECMNGAPLDNFNYHSVSMRYKKTTDTSWSSTSLFSSSYDENINYDRKYSATLDSTAIYQFEFTITDKFGKTNTYSTTLSIADTLIDYNKSGHSLAFGMPSQAAESDYLIDTCYPIFFSTDISNGDWKTNSCDYIVNNEIGIINQRPGNSSKYYTLFAHTMTSSTYGSKDMYGIICKDTDSYSAAEMYMKVRHTGLKMTYNSLEFNAQTSSSATGYGNGYYFKIQPGSTYCDFYTNSDRYYFNNSDVYIGQNLYISNNGYMGGNLLATQNWVNNQGYKTSAATLTGSYSSIGQYDSGSSVYYGSNYFNIAMNGTSYVQICFGRSKVGSVPDGYSGQYKLTKSISFPSSFGKAPLVLICPQFDWGNKDWKCMTSVSNVSTSSFTAVYIAEGFITDNAYVNWIAIGHY